MKIFLVSGLSGAGKTYIATELAKMMYNTYTIELDTYYIEGTERWEEPVGFDWKAIFKSLKQCISEQKDAVIIDGIMSLYLYFLIIYFKSEEDFSQMNVYKQITKQQMIDVCNMIQENTLDYDFIDQKLKEFLQQQSIKDMENSVIITNKEEYIKTILSKTQQEQNNSSITFYHLLIQTDVQTCIERRLQREISFEGEQQYFLEQVVPHHNFYCKGIANMLFRHNIQFIVYKQ